MSNEGPPPDPSSKTHGKFYGLPSSLDLNLHLADGRVVHLGPEQSTPSRPLPPGPMEMALEALKAIGGDKKAP